MISDTDSTDSEEGIRFKTTSTRNKDERPKSRKYDRSPTRHKIDERSSSTSAAASSSSRYRTEHHKSKKSKHRDHRKSPPRHRSPSPPPKVKIRPPSPPPVAIERRKSPEVETIVEYFGPSLPPSLLPSTSTSTAMEVDAAVPLGPLLPPKLITAEATPSTSSSASNGTTEERVFGPKLPNFELPPPITTTVAAVSPSALSTEDLSSDDDQFDVIGPLPPSAARPNLTRTEFELEKRAIELRMSAIDAANNQKNGNSEKGREEWMLELPEVRTVADLGLGARQFRTKERPDFSDRYVFAVESVRSGF